MEYMNTQYIAIPIFIVSTLLIPYVLGALWSAFDYMAAATLLSVTATAVVLASSHMKSAPQKILAVFSIILLALYVWAELAVGIFTNLGS